MMQRIIRSVMIVWFAIAVSSVRADTVIASIKPVSLIAAELLRGVAEVETLLPDGASPHDFSLRPSDRLKVDAASLIIWVGPETEPYLTRVITAAGVSDLSWQESEEEHAGHSHNHADEHEHGDLHPWLSLESAEHFSERLALRLKQLFPENAAKIEENERVFLTSLAQFDVEARQRLAPVQSEGFFVFHDAYQGLVEHFELNQVGYFTLDPSRKPGAKHLAQLRQQLEQSAASCVFVEPQFKPALVESITRGLSVKQGELDPLATGIELTPGAYLDFMERLVAQLSSCLAP